MTVGLILLFFGVVLLSGSALIAFFWAVRTGQLQNLDKAPEVIFDEGEPVGKPTDCFPDERARRALKQAQSQA
jgi:cbb3-type cytochrome oxidase maturation protein